MESFYSQPLERYIFNSCSRISQAGYMPFSQLFPRYSVGDSQGLNRMELLISNWDMDAQRLVFDQRSYRLSDHVFDLPTKEITNEFWE